MANKFLSGINVTGTATLNTVANAGTDTDKFLVLDASGNIDFRTGDELYADLGIGALPAGYTSTLKHEVKAGVALTKGQAVYVTSADGTNMIVGKASNASESTSSKTLGLIESSLSSNGIGNVITEGLLAGLNTTGANAAGDSVWLGTDGNLLYGLANKPSAPAHMVFIGIVTRVNANNGEIFVKVQNGFEMGELHNYAESGVANNSVIAYESSTSLYKPKSIATILGYTPANAATYVPYTGATTDVDLGIYSLTTSNTLNANSVWANQLAGGSISAGAATLNLLGSDIIFATGTAGSSSWTEKMRLKVDGNFGIGNAAPSHKLDVSGTGRFTGKLLLGNTDGEMLKFQSATSTGSTYLRFYNSAGTSRGYLGLFWNGSADYMAYDSGALQMNFNSSNGFTFTGGGAATFSSSITAGSFVKSGGTSAQILMADGSVLTAGTNITISGGTISSSGGGGSYVPLAGGTMTGALQINTNTSGLILNRGAVTNYTGVSYQTAGAGQWFVGMRENLSSNNYIIYNESGTDAVTISKSNNAVTLAGSITTVNGNIYMTNTNYAFGTNNWAGAGGYPGYSFTGGNSRFGFSSTSGYIDVYTDGNFYAGIDLNGSNNLVLHTGNYNSYAPTLTGGGASGTWGISITGSAGGVAWSNVSGRPTAVSSFTNDSGYITGAGRAYPRRSDGSEINFYWSGQGGQPSWLWGGNDATNMYVWNPSNFSVNYANSAGSASTATTATNLSGFDKTNPTFGAVYATNWFRSYGDSGLYNQDYACHWRRNVQSSYGTWEAFGYNKNGYSGLLQVDPSGYLHNLMYESGNGGMYTQNGNGWQWYYNISHNCVSVGGSTTDGSVVFRVNGNARITGNLSQEGGYAGFGGDVQFATGYTQYHGSNTAYNWRDWGGWGGYWWSRNGGDMIMNLYALYAVTGSISDMRYKKDVTSLSYGLNEIMQLNPIKYHYNLPKESMLANDPDFFLGFSAQEVQGLIPEAVHEKIGEDTTPGMLAITYDELIPVLVNGIKEQQVMIQNQNIKINKLETLINQLLNN